MKRHNHVIVGLVVLAFVVPSVAPSVRAASFQAATMTPGVVLSRLEIRYPSIAESARVSGIVRVRVGVRPDGSVAETTLLEGDDLLNSAAIDAASAATFECRRCTEPATPHVIVFDFSFADARLPTTWKQTSDASSEVTVVGEVQILEFGPPSKPPRAARCFWLWHCSKYRRIYQ